MEKFYKKKIRSLKSCRTFCISTSVLVLLLTISLGIISARTYEERAYENLNKIINGLSSKEKNDLTNEKFIIEFISNSDRETISLLSQSFYFGGTILGSVLVSQAFSLTKRINDYEEKLVPLENL